jgi:tetratricopeptide (TPR) repeat protein
MSWSPLRLLISALLCSGLFGSAPARQSPQSATRSGPPGVVLSAKPTPASPVPASPPAIAPENPLGDALILFRKGDVDGAIQKYQLLIAAKPKSPDAYAGLVRAYLKKKDVTQAYATAQRALQDADSAPVRVALGEVYFRQGKIDGAEAEWAAVINSGHQNARAYLGLARVRASRSLYKGASTLIEKAHQLDPNDPEISKRWTAHLSRAERIKYLEEYLAGQNNEDAETLAGMRHYLEYLKARAQDSRGCELVTKTTSTETQLLRLFSDPQHLRGFGLPVGVNTQKSRLLLDTGASGIMINSRIAEKAGVTKISETEIYGIGDRGGKKGYFGLASSLKIGDLEFKDCPVRVIEERNVTGEDGLIGADVFSNFLIDLDFAKEKLRLSQLPRRPGESTAPMNLRTEDEDDSARSSSQSDGKASLDSRDVASQTAGPQDRYIGPEMKSFTQVYRFGHYLLVPTVIGKSSTSSKLFMLDSGSLSNLISASAATEVTNVHRDSDTVVKGISGRVEKVYTADKAVLQFGHLRQENQDLIAFDLTHLSDSAGTEISGLLGFALLRLLDVKIDYRDGLVDFHYDAEQWKWFAQQPE